MDRTAAILLVDDSELARGATEQVLRDHGFAVRSAPDVPAALEHLERDPPDVVVCELQLGSASGFDFVMDPLVATSGIPVIMTSSDESVSTVLLAMRHGAFEYVIKTEDFAPLLAAIQRAWAHRRVVVENRSLRSRMRDRLREAQDARDALEQEVVERRRAERALAEAHRRTSRASTAKSHFLASMSHELRTPLNAIIGYTELVRDELHDIEVTEVDGDLAHILGASRHLLALVNEVLDLSRIESGRLETDIQPVSIRGLVDDIATTVRPLAHTKNNRFVLDRSEQLGVVFTDPGRVRQILLNLLGNAFKFTEEGVVTLSVERQEQPQPTVRFSVRDDGIGMTQAQCERIFEPFVQAEASTAGRFGGSGLGLAISRQLCRLLGGQLAVESTVGEGSLFTATFPVVPSGLAPDGNAWRVHRLLALVETEASARTFDQECWEPVVAGGDDVMKIRAERRICHLDPALGMAIRRRSGPVFVVEDDPVVRVILERGLRHRRCEARAFSDGESFLAELNLTEPAAVLLDLNLPGIDGFSLVDRLTERFPDVPIIVLTGQNLDQVQLPFLAQRCAAVLAKHHAVESGALVAIRLAATLLGDPDQD